MKHGKIQKTIAMRELERKGFAYRATSYHDDGSMATGLGASIAERLGENPEQAFKTLMTVCPSGEYVVCCIPVAEELDLKLAAHALGEKSLSMLPMKELLPVTGYVRGGCSPLGMKKRYRTLIDETCELWDEIYISGGRRGLSLALRPEDLIAATDAITADICRG